MMTMQGGDSLVGGLPIIHITYQQYIANPRAYQDPDVIVHISGFPTAGNLPADYVGYDSNLNMEDIGNIATKAIAKVEPSDTALYLHNVGDGFINKDGNYCITDVQIAVGGSIALGTNCHVVDGGISSKLIQRHSGTGTTNNDGLINITSIIGNWAYFIGATVAENTNKEICVTLETYNTNCYLRLATPGNTPHANLTVSYVIYYYPH